MNYWTCPFCGYRGKPIKSSKVSGTGWIIFFLLFLFTCALLCWIGLLFTDVSTFCPACQTKVA